MNIVKTGTNQSITDISDDRLMAVLKSSLYPGAADDSVRMVIAYCKAANLDPMQKPVHIVPMWDSKSGGMRDVIMPGVGLYRTQAARTGEYAGVTEPEYGPDVTETLGGVEITYPAWCKVTVLRSLKNGTLANFTATERWKENYAVKGGKEKSIAPNAMWQKRPYGQISKCAEAQALRKAFPEVGAQPTAEEMEGKQIERDITPDQSIQREPAMYPADLFERNFPKWRSAIQSGRHTSQSIIDLAQDRGKFTEEQLLAVRAVVPDGPSPEESEQ